MNIWTVWGHFKQVVNQLGTYYSLYSMIAVSLILWRTVIKPLLDEYKLDVSVAWFILVFIGVNVILVIVEWKRSTPGYFRSWTQLFYTKDNPLRQDVEQIKRDIEELKNR